MHSTIQLACLDGRMASPGETAVRARPNLVRHAARIVDVAVIEVTVMWRERVYVETI